MIYPLVIEELERQLRASERHINYLESEIETYSNRLAAYNAEHVKSLKAEKEIKVVITLLKTKDH